MTVTGDQREEDHEHLTFEQVHVWKFSTKFGRWISIVDPCVCSRRQLFVENGAQFVCNFVEE